MNPNKEYLFHHGLTLSFAHGAAGAKDLFMPFFARPAAEPASGGLPAFAMLADGQADLDGGGTIRFNKGQVLLVQGDYRSPDGARYALADPAELAAKGFALAADESALAGWLEDRGEKYELGAPGDPASAAVYPFPEGMPPAFALMHFDDGTPAWNVGPGVPVPVAQGGSLAHLFRSGEERAFSRSRLALGAADTRRAIEAAGAPDQAQSFASEISERFSEASRSAAAAAANKSSGSSAFQAGKAALLFAPAGFALFLAASAAEGAAGAAPSQKAAASPEYDFAYISPARSADADALAQERQSAPSEDLSASFEPAQGIPEIASKLAARKSRSPAKQAGADPSPKPRS